MDELDYSTFSDDGFTIRLVGAPNTIEVDTLVETLIGFSEALKEINAVVNPEHELEVLIDGVSPGSIKILVRLKKHIKEHKTAYMIAGFALSHSYDIISGVLGNYIYDQIKEEKQCVTEHHPGYVIVQGDGCNERISVEGYQARQKIEDNPRVAEGVSRAIQAADKDQAVEGIAIEERHQPDRPAPRSRIFVPRTMFSTVEERLTAKMPPKPGSTLIKNYADLIGTELSSNYRQETVRATLIIIKVVFARTRRKWQFNWQGMKVSAAISDSTFFDQLEERSISLAQGDALDADLCITQRFIQEANVWENVSYEVTTVHKVQKGETQTTFELSNTSWPGRPGLPPPRKT